MISEEGAIEIMEKRLERKQEAKLMGLVEENDLPKYILDSLISEGILTFAKFSKWDKRGGL